ncbi:hypothetical protein [uncultured Muriicola sp.]|uniref:hypothetical protein n=1 Tax=uncultured Muriicola sp. TaxID=1583102 RepID=UPI00262E896F|nr:hypothetical protein [uncultured Muriicola sp.]
MKEDNIDELFKKAKPYFDLEEPRAGHKARFIEKLNTTTVEPKRGVSWWKPLSIAASILVVMGLFLGQNLWLETEKERIAEISPEISNSEFYFANIIEQQVKQLESEKSPETEKIIEDALGQLALLESDYKKLEQDLLKGGNNNIILRSMIQNFQTRIDLMQDVLIQIEIIKNLKNQQNENSIT